MSESGSSPELRSSASTKYDIAFFIYDKEGFFRVRWSDLLKEFVENGSARHISRQRLSDYLKELCDEGLVNKTVDPKALAMRMVWRVYPVYTVPKNRRKRIEELRSRKEIYEFVDSASPEKIKKIYEQIRRLKETED